MTMSSTTLIPRIHRAVVATGPGSLALRPVPVPPIADDQVLVLVAAIALNPSDYKLLDQSTTQGAVSGSDFAGTVVRVGAGVGHRVQVGDRICGLVFGANPGCPGNGAWGQYVAATLDLCMPIPPEMDFATAASLPMGTGTAGLAFRSLGLRWDRLAASSTVQETNANEYVLVHGGATATGTVLLQLLRMAGYAPLATCSPANFDLVIGRGAIRAFDYRSPTCVDDIRAYTGDRLAYVLDCIGNVDTMTLCYGAIGDQGGRYSALEYYPRTLTIRRRDVAHDWILGWTLFGAEVQLAGVYHRPPIPEDRLFGKQWVELVGQLVMQGRLQPHPLDIIPGPLSTVIPQVDRLRQGKFCFPYLFLLVVVSAVGYYVATAVYILYFYPLARFPGPKLWLITRIPNARDLASGRLMHRIRQFHEQYGPVVRWAPNELSFIDGQAWKDIYGHHGPGQDFPRNPLYYPRAANVEASCCLIRMGDLGIYDIEQKSESEEQIRRFRNRI
ncbi:hypothetical protein CFD26_101544 [Aspergillus turcosus]|uniref:Enoyl reductase (ER) domain-containing protein n=1 Tax=Aspergillus turcosus TaxID=1245748 RepID=A0A421CVA5_9EURO|nr:hypothetical protein CFD26_101544 [Aspergillus turcosus]